MITLYYEVKLALVYDVINSRILLLTIQVKVVSYFTNIQFFYNLLISCIININH